MTLRAYTERDLRSVLALFHSTVHTVNAKDYSQAQLDAWAPPDPDEASWQDRLMSTSAFVVEAGGVLVGVGSLTAGGVVDLLYVANHYIRHGVGAALLTKLLGEASNKGLPRVVAEVSITARPFFEKHGFRVEKEQTVDVRGQTLTNYRMVRESDEREVSQE